MSADPPLNIKTYGEAAIIMLLQQQTGSSYITTTTTTTTIKVNFCGLLKLEVLLRLTVTHCMALKPV